MGIKAEIRYQKLNRRQIDEQSKKNSVHPWTEIIRSQQKEIRQLRLEIEKLTQELSDSRREKEKAIKAYNRRNAEVNHLKVLLNEMNKTYE
jgi:uncharacterized protein YlxW (UPF0749 family)